MIQCNKSEYIGTACICIYIKPRGTSSNFAKREHQIVSKLKNNKNKYNLSIMFFCTEFTFYKTIITN